MDAPPAHSTASQSACASSRRESPPRPPPRTACSRHEEPPHRPGRRCITTRYARSATHRRVTGNAQRALVPAHWTSPNPGSTRAVGTSAARPRNPTIGKPPACDGLARRTTASVAPGASSAPAPHALARDDQRERDAARLGSRDALHRQRWGDHQVPRGRRFRAVACALRANRSSLPAAQDVLLLDVSGTADASRLALESQHSAACVGYDVALARLLLDEPSVD